MPHIGTPNMTKDEKADHEKWRAQDDVRTLISAGEIQGDTKRLDRAMKEARSQMASLKKVKSNA